MCVTHTKTLNDSSRAFRVLTNVANQSVPGSDFSFAQPNQIHTLNPHTIGQNNANLMAQIDSKEERMVLEIHILKSANTHAFT